MKVLELVQSHYAILGVSPSNQWTQKCPFNARVLSVFSLFFCTLVSHSMYICRAADGFMDYMVCICSTSASIMSIVCFAAIVLRKSELFEVIDNMEKLIDTSVHWFNSIGKFEWNSILKFKLYIIGCKYPKSREFFLKAIQQAEQITEILFLVVFKISLQCFMLPRCITSFGVYLFTNSGSDSFELPIPLW